MNEHMVESDGLAAGRAIKAGDWLQSLSPAKVAAWRD